MQHTNIPRIALNPVNYFKFVCTKRLAAFKCTQDRKPWQQLHVSIVPKPVKPTNIPRIEVNPGNRFSFLKVTKRLCMIPLLNITLSLYHSHIHKIEKPADRLNFVIVRIRL